jgi:hypothetical protein
MNLWGAPLIAVTILGGGATGHSASASVSPFSVAPVALPGNGAPTPVLRQEGTGTWETTVLLNDTNADCAIPSTATFELATTTPDRLITSKSAKPTPGGSSPAAPGSYCHVTVNFGGLTRVPETATLILDEPGALATVQLTVSQDVTALDYFLIPALTGIGIALLSLLLATLLLGFSGRKMKGQQLGLRDRLQRPILGAGAWTANDSWATNISSGLVVVGAVLGVTGATSTLFPGVALDRFSMVNIVAGLFVAAAPVAFGILYSCYTALNPGLMAEATVGLPHLRAAVVRVPSGASITVAGDTTISDGNHRWATVRGGGTYQIPPGTEVYVISGLGTVVPTVLGTLDQEQIPLDERAAQRVIAVTVARDADLSCGDSAAQLSSTVVRNLSELVEFPPGSPQVWSQVGMEIQDALEGTGNDDAAVVSDAIAYAAGTDIGVLPGSTLLTSAPAGGLTIAASEVLAPVPAAPAKIDLPEPQDRVALVQTVPVAAPSAADTSLTHPVLIDATSGAKITVTGAADVTLPRRSVISAPRQPPYPLPRKRQLLAPQGSNVIVANLGIILLVNLLTMFGIGAELGIAGILAHYSIAAGGGRLLLFAALIVVSALVIVYAATATRAIADPQPGSSMSSQSGASFTL